MLKTPLIGFPILLALAAGSPATAQVDMTEAQVACQGDVLRLCPAYILDRNAIIACMHQNRASLSARCGTIFDKGTRAMARHPTVE